MNTEGIEKILENAWDSIDYRNGGSLQLPLHGPLDWFVTYQSQNCKGLATVSKYPLQGLESSKSIITSCNVRKDGKFYISFQLTENAEKSVFMTMCSDLIEYSLDASDEKTALKKVEFRYKQWRRLMAKKHEGILSEEKRKGLIGELLYLKEMLKQMPHDKAMEGWVGPEGADQDFVYDNVWREIKTTGPASASIEIHSLEQLGTREDTGILRVYRVDKCATETKDAFTLPELISEINTELRNDPDLIERFMVKLNAAGYIDIDVYSKFTYKFFSADDYTVDNKFPRIVRSDICSQIINCSYSLSLAAIADWKRD